MPRPRAATRALFEDTGTRRCGGKFNVFVCKRCGVEILENAYRFAVHISVCKKATDEDRALAAQQLTKPKKHSAANTPRSSVPGDVDIYNRTGAGEGKGGDSGGVYGVAHRHSEGVATSFNSYRSNFDKLDGYAGRYSHSFDDASSGFGGNHGYFKAGRRVSGDVNCARDPTTELLQQASAQMKAEWGMNGAGGSGPGWGAYYGSPRQETLHGQREAKAANEAGANEVRNFNPGKAYGDRHRFSDLSTTFSGMMPGMNQDIYGSSSSSRDYLSKAPFMPPQAPGKYAVAINNRQPPNWYTSSADGIENSEWQESNFQMGRGSAQPFPSGSDLGFGTFTGGTRMPYELGSREEFGSQYAIAHYDNLMASQMDSPTVMKGQTWNSGAMPYQQMWNASDRPATDVRQVPSNRDVYVPGSSYTSYG